MKTILVSIIIIAIISGGYYLYTKSDSSVKNMVEEKSIQAENGSVPQNGTYAVITEESEIGWTAGKPLIADYTHHGIIKVKNGTIIIGDDTASGSFIIDMTSLKVTSLGGGKEGRESQLESHLKTGDFFDVEKYPTASFSISKVTPTDVGGVYIIDGSLTMKDVTDTISYPAQIYEKDGKLYAVADFTIDRTKWGITFGSANFFSNIANNAISDEVTLSLNLVAVLNEVTTSN